MIRRVTPVLALAVAFAISGTPPIATAAPVGYGCVATGGSGCRNLIPDGSVSLNLLAASSITVPTEACTSVIGVSVGLNLRHGHVGDLVVILQHDGKSVTLLDRPGRPDDATSGFGCAGEDLSTLVDDAASTPVELVCDEFDYPSIGGTVQPAEALATFQGSPCAGSWLLLVQDRANGGYGAIDDWSVILDNGAPVPVASPVAAVALVVAASGLLAGARSKRRKQRRP